MRKLTIISACIMMFLFASGCAIEEVEPEQADPPINVMTTIYPLADIVGELGGDKVNVSYLLPAGVSPHTYEPTVEQARLVDEAQLFIYIGAGLDNWAVRLAETSEADLVLIDLSQKVDLIESIGYRSLEEHDHDDHENDHDDHDHDHGPSDPHFWLDPLIVRDSICPVIHNQLITIAPDKEKHFNQKLDQYRQEITALHEDIEEAASAFSRKGFIAFHSAWQYFGQRYDLEEVAVIADFPGQEPSAGWLAELVELIKSEDIGAIFTEPQFPTALADRIAEESGSEVKIIDPLGGEDVPGRESYIKMMRFNLDSFREAMK